MAASEADSLPAYHLHYPAKLDSNCQSLRFGLERVSGPFGEYLVHVPELKRTRPWQDRPGYVRSLQQWVCERFLYWEDEEEDHPRDKDLKKLISANFKKWNS